MRGKQRFSVVGMTARREAPTFRAASPARAFTSGASNQRMNVPFRADWPERAFSFDSLFSYNHITNSGFQYDAAGNMTHDASHSYTYDAENRITKV
jgi:hypothetical protein